MIAADQWLPIDPFQRPRNKLDRTLAAHQQLPDGPKANVNKNDQLGGEKKGWRENESVFLLIDCKKVLWLLSVSCRGERGCSLPEWQAENFCLACH